MRLMLLTFITMTLSSVAFSWATPSADIHVTIITDSHGAGPFGQALITRLRSVNHLKYDFVAVGGSAPFQWLASKNRFKSTFALKDHWNNQTLNITKPVTMVTPTLSSLIEKAQAESAHLKKKIVIAHGTNYKMVKDLSQTDINYHINSTVKLLNLLPSDAECIWIGPPDMRKTGYEVGFRAQASEKSDTRYFIIREALKRWMAQDKNNSCTLIESFKFTKYPAQGGDGIHYYNPKDVVQWVDYVFKTL